MHSHKLNGTIPRTPQNLTELALKSK